MFSQNSLKLDLYIILIDLRLKKNFSVLKTVRPSVSQSKWYSPVAPVVKKNGHVRLCGDYKMTINPVMKVDQYPLPHIKDVFASSLAGGQKFSKT